MKTAAAFLGMWLATTSPAFACAPYTCDDPRSEGWAERQKQEEQAENPCRPEQTFRKGICWDRVILHPSIPAKFRGLWCWHNNEGQKWTYGRRAPIGSCYRMWVEADGLQFGDKPDMRCVPLNLTEHNNRLHFKGKCSVPDLGDSDIIDGTAWIEDDEYIVFEVKPRAMPVPQAEPTPPTSPAPEPTPPTIPCRQIDNCAPPEPPR
jgi:hypothetical protein